MSDAQSPNAASPLPAQRRAELLSVLNADTALRVSDLATQLGVSVMTIRRDLAELQRQGLIRRVHGGAVLPQTPVAVPSKSETRGKIGLLVPSLDFYWPSVARSAETAAARRGLRLLLRGDSYDSVDERPALASLFAMNDVVGVGAVINTMGPHSTEVLEWLAQQTKPVVLIEREAVSGHFHQAVESVVTDHAEGAAAAAQHLWDLGHRRIGCVVSRSSPTTRKIMIGWRAACQQLGLPEADVMVEEVPDHRTTSFAPTVDTIIDRCLEDGLTGLLVHSDREAIGLVQHLEARGLRVPDDLSVVSYDDELAALFSPALTAVRPARDALGASAIDLLAARLADPGRPVHRVTISPELFVRESTGPVSSNR